MKSDLRFDGYSFLSLEDHPPIQDVLSRLITELFPDSVIEFAFDTDTAIKLLQNKPDFVISDIQVGGKKQLTFVDSCREMQIPCLVYSSFLQISLINKLQALKSKVFVSKSSDIVELKKGLMSLVKGKEFYCSKTINYIKRHNTSADEIQPVEFSDAEEQIIICAFKGMSVKETADKLCKSESTISNQRIHLMMVNQCNMQELIRRYLYWNSEG